MRERVVGLLRTRARKLYATLLSNLAIAVRANLRKLYESQIAIGIGRRCGILASWFIYGASFFASQTISILVALMVLRIVLHARVSSFGTWLSAVLCVVPMHLHQLYFQQQCAKRRSDIVDELERLTLLIGHDFDLFSGLSHMKRKFPNKRGFIDEHP